MGGGLVSWQDEEREFWRGDDAAKTQKPSIVILRCDPMVSNTVR